MAGPSAALGSFLLAWEVFFGFSLMPGFLSSRALLLLVTAFMSSMLFAIACDAAKPWNVNAELVAWALRLRGMLAASPLSTVAAAEGMVARVDASSKRACALCH